MSETPFRGQPAARKSFGAALHQLRRAFDYSQHKLSVATGLTRQRINGLEHGRRSVTRDEIAILDKALPSLTRVADVIERGLHVG